MLSKHLLPVNQKTSPTRPYWRVATQSCSGGCHPSELSVLGQDPRAGTERSGWEVTPAISAHSQHPRLWIQGFAALFARPAFVCFFSSSCSIQQPPLTTCPPVWRPWPLEASAKASSQRLGQHVPRLIGSSQHPASPGLANKKGGGYSPVPMAPYSPTHKAEATKTFSTMAGVGIRFHPE